MTNNELRTNIHAGICEQIKDTYERKNSDYGDSFAVLRKRYPNQVVIRLHDKLLRLERLLDPAYTAKVKDESIEDTLIDLANYAILELVEMRYDKAKTHFNKTECEDQNALIQNKFSDPKTGEILWQHE